jgi:catechol 2,3-dioxygenase-like lactoylglutathione lyase family enzyme
MAQQLGAVTFLVRDYDEAIAFFTGKLGFTLVEDTPLGGDKRWVKVIPAGAAGTGLLLAKAATPEQLAAVGRQGGGRVFLFLETDSFARDYRAMRTAGVEFTEQPRHEAYGSVVVFRDLYGNKWDLVESRRPG